MIVISKQQARNYILDNSGFNSDRNVIQILEDLSCIQVDPLNIVARSHEIALYNRNKDFHKQDLYSALYADHKLFEYWLQLFSIIPASSFQYLHSIPESPIGWNFDPKTKFQKNYAKKHRAELFTVLEFIEKNGPTIAKDLRHLPKGSPLLSWKGQDSHSALLEYLWGVGKIQISDRKSNVKYYDLTSRFFPENTQVDKIGKNTGIKFIVDSYFKYLGLVSTAMLSRSGRSRTKMIRDEFARQLKNNEVVEVRIEDETGKLYSTKYFIQRKSLRDLQNATRLRHQGINILSPLDPLIINRQLVLDSFGFFYRWEGYTPKSKRKFGHYNMPILNNGRLIGQIDLAKIDGKLVTRNLFLNEESKEITQALKEELLRFEKFCLE